MTLGDIPIILLVQVSIVKRKDIGMNIPLEIIKSKLTQEELNILKEELQKESATELMNKLNRLQSLEDSLITTELLVISAIDDFKKVQIKQRETNTRRHVEYKRSVDQLNFKVGELHNILKEIDVLRIELASVIRLLKDK